MLAPPTINEQAASEQAASRILTVRGVRVLLDGDLAKLYGVQTKVLNQAVRRNRGRFPGDFLFQLSDREFESLRSQTVTSKTGRGGRQYRPWAFTEHGTIMAASVLNSARAVAMSVFVVRAFVRLREVAGTQAALAAKLDLLERRVVDHDGSIQALFQAIRKLLEPPVRNPKRIGFRPDDTEGP